METKLLAKRIVSGLKKDLGCESARLGYKGTGTRAHRRQLWCRFEHGIVTDLWLEADHIEIGGVASGLGHGRVSYRDTPEATYEALRDVLAGLLRKATWTLAGRILVDG